MHKVEQEIRDIMTKYSGFIWVDKSNISDYSSAIQKKLSYLLDNPKVRQEIHQVYADMTEKYVPLDTGALRESVRVTPNAVSWRTRYAHYMHEGVVYGPNFPIKMHYTSTGTQEIVGWWSPKGKRKHPTDRFLRYYTPGTQSHWTTAVRTHYPDKLAFPREVTRILKRYSRGE